MVFVNVELEAPLRSKDDGAPIRLRIDDADNGAPEQKEMIGFQLYSLLDVPPRYMSFSYRRRGGDESGTRTLLTFPFVFREGDALIVRLVLPWDAECSRVFSRPGQRLAQPCFRTTVGGVPRRVCAGCASTCHGPGGAAPEYDDDDDDGAFECRCDGGAGAGGGCLFRARFSSEVVPSEPLGRAAREARDEHRYGEEAARRRVGGGEKSMMARLRSYASQVGQYENPSTRRRAREELVPHGRLWTAACEADGVAPVVARADEDYPALVSRHLTAVGERALLRELLVWFKNDVFSWVNRPPCGECGSEETTGAGMAAPTPEDARHGASRVEAYRCARCGATTRFPRYNSAAHLLFTSPRGRCGEWANAFTLVCRSLGYPARFVVDWTDHVWTEVWLTHEQRWCHADSCEAALDCPLLYEAGWGKKLSYVVAFSTRENGPVRDVTRRYTRRWRDASERRTAVSERFLEGLVAYLNRARDVSDDAAKERGRSETKEIDQWTRDAEEGVSERDVSQEESQGRLSGDLRWRRARGEMGLEKEQSEDKKGPAQDGEKETKSEEEPEQNGEPATKNDDATVSPPSSPSENAQEELSRLVRLHFARLTTKGGAADSGSDDASDHAKLRGTFAKDPNGAAVKALELAMADMKHASAVPR